MSNTVTLQLTHKTERNWNHFVGLDWSLLVKYLELKIYTILGYIVSLILLNLGHDAKAKQMSQIQED